MPAGADGGLSVLQLGAILIALALLIGGGAWFWMRQHERRADEGPLQRPPPPKPPRPPSAPPPTAPPPPGVPPQGP